MMKLSHSVILAALVGTLSYDEVKAVQLKAESRFIDLTDVALGHSSDEEEEEESKTKTSSGGIEELNGIAPGADPAKDKEAALAKAKADKAKAEAEAAAKAKAAAEAEAKAKAEEAARKAEEEAKEAARIAAYKKQIAEEAAERARKEKEAAEAEARHKAELKAKADAEAKANFGETDEIKQLRQKKKTTEDVLKEMDVDDAVKKLPAPSPTVASAAAIGIQVPSKEETDYDQNTGLKKKKDTPPALVPDESSSNSTNSTTSTSTESASDNSVKVDSVGNVITKPAPTKAEILAEETQKILRKRKAEAKAAEYNSKIDAKINEIKAKNYQATQIDSVFKEVKADVETSNLEKVKTMAQREVTKRPDVDGDSWAANMPEHFQKEGDDTTKGIKPEASSMIINATNAASILTTGQKTAAGANVEASLSDSQQ